MPENSIPDDDEVIQSIPAECLEAVDRGRLAQKHSNYAASNFEFLDNNQLVGAAIGGFRELDKDAVVDSAFAQTLDSQSANPSTKFEIGDPLR